MVEGLADDGGPTTPQAGRVLGIEPEDIYRLIFAGDLERIHARISSSVG